MLVRLAGIGALIALAAAAMLWWLSAPDPLPAAALDGIEGDAEAGARIYAASGCASCHLREGAETLGGGAAFVSDFGTFYAPNISMHREHGLGEWDRTAFANAVIRGISPAGAHYYPAFPYTSYVRMEMQDVADLWAYMQTLEADATPSKAHEVAFPFTLRRGIGLWKARYRRADYHMDATEDETLARGRYLVEALGHCAECHTPRDAFGGLDRARWMQGAPNPSGKGEIPALTPDEFDWSATDIAYYLETGFTPDFDSAGGSMAKVVAQTGKLPDADRQAIAAYVKALPAP